jgi:hypothetical protein
VDPPDAVKAREDLARKAQAAQRQPGPARRTQQSSSVQGNQVISSPR